MGLMENESRVVVSRISKRFGVRGMLTDGETQVQAYGRKLEQKYGNLRLRKFVVAALGFERVCFKKIGN